MFTQIELDQENHNFMIQEKITPRGSRTSLLNLHGSNTKPRSCLVQVANNTLTFVCSHGNLDIYIWPILDSKEFYYWLLKVFAMSTWATQSQGHA